MQEITLNSYFGIFRIPFVLYILDLSGTGSIEIDHGLLNTTNNLYDLVNISNAQYSATFWQKVFGVGDVIFFVKENNENKQIVLENIRDAKYITKLLRNHRQEIIENYMNQSDFVHLV